MRGGIWAAFFCVLLLLGCQPVAGSITELTETPTRAPIATATDEVIETWFALPEWLKDPESDTLVFLQTSWVDGEDARLVFVNAATGELFELPRVQPEMRSFFWMPDGHRLGLAVGKDAEIRIVDMRTGGIQPVEFVGQTDGDPWTSFGVTRYFAVGNDPAAEEFQLLSRGSSNLPLGQYAVEQLADELKGEYSVIVRGNNAEREYSGLPDFPVTRFSDLSPDGLRMTVTQFSRPFDLGDFFTEQPEDIEFQVAVYRLEDGALESRFPGWISSSFSPDGQSFVSKRWIANIDQSLPCVYSFDTTQQTCIGIGELLPHLDASIAPSFRSFNWLEDSSGLMFVYEIPAEDFWIRVGGLCTFEFDSREALCWLEDLPQPVHVHFFELSPTSDYLWFYASESCFACDYSAPATVGIMEVVSGEYRLFTTEEMMVATYSMHWRPAISD